MNIDDSTERGSVASDENGVYGHLCGKEAAITDTDSFSGSVVFHKRAIFFIYHR